MSWPVIWVFTLTVLSAVTVPSARITTGMSPLVAEARPAGVATPVAKPSAPLLGNRAVLEDVPAGAQDDSQARLIRFAAAS